MAYRLDINDDFSVYRSRNTGAIGLWQRNNVYGYYAAVEYLPDGQKMTLRTLDRWATHAGESVEITRAKYVKMIREGGAGMKPCPGFELL